jgi:hypothetical protein
LPASSAEILITERWPKVELKLWKFIPFPVSGRQFLLISGSTPPAELKQPWIRAIRHSAQSIQELNHEGFSHKKNPDSFVCDHGQSSSQRRDTFCAAVVLEFSNQHLQRHVQLNPALYQPYQQVRLLLYHATHRILYDEAGRSRACREVTSGEGRSDLVIR